MAEKVSFKSNVFVVALGVDMRGKARYAQGGRKEGRKPVPRNK